ncbi:MAG: GDP-mannose 4,6-dehydratase [Candidatus Wildermuthbacteria bacterium]|nr:GDP-mannose 4,6-dehydratase [Candidatus Wildermuthbacteria bacterium]
MKTCLITGGAGFIGSHLADALIHKGYRVVIIDNLSTGRRENVNPKAFFHKTNIQNPRVSRIFQKEKPFAVFHFAAHIEARKSVGDPIADALSNICGTLSILEQCRKYNVKRFVFASSGGEVYGDAKDIPTPETYDPAPVSPYGVAKLAAEKYIEAYEKLYSISPLILRLGNVYGPRQNPKGEAGVVAIFTGAMLQKTGFFIHGDGKQTKDYIFIDDVIEAIMKAWRKNKSGIFNIGTGKETSVNEIFLQLRKLTRSETDPRHVSPPLILFRRGALSITKAKRQLHWKPKTVLEKGLYKTVAWFKK